MRKLCVVSAVANVIACFWFPTQTRRIFDSGLVAQLLECGEAPLIGSCEKNCELVFGDAGMIPGGLEVDRMAEHYQGIQEANAVWVEIQDGYIGDSGTFSAGGSVGEGSDVGDG